MKAFLVRDPSDDHVQIIFAEKRSDAIRASEAMNWHEYIKIRATRQPQFDMYAEQGFVPKQMMLEDGWWFECCGYKEEPRRRCCQVQTIDDKPVVLNEEVYCQDCASRLNAG